MLHRNRGAEGGEPMAIGEFGDAPASPGDGGLVLSGPMYWFWEMNRAALHPARAMADLTRLSFKNPMNPSPTPLVGSAVAATCELSEPSPRHYGRPEWEIESSLM